MGAIDGTTMGLSEGGCRRSRIETLECRRFDPGGVGKLQRMPVKERSINPPPEPPSGEEWLVNDQQQCSVQFKSEPLRLFPWQKWCHLSPAIQTV